MTGRKFKSTLGKLQLFNSELLHLELLWNKASSVYLQSESDDIVLIFLFFSDKWLSFNTEQVALDLTLQCSGHECHICSNSSCIYLVEQTEQIVRLKSVLSYCCIQLIVLFFQFSRKWSLLLLSDQDIVNSKHQSYLVSFYKLKRWKHSAVERHWRTLYFMFHFNSSIICTIMP